MAEHKFQIESFIRGQSASVISIEAHSRYCRLGTNQPLLLVREPNHPNDMAAVLVKDLMGGPCGYVAKEHAPQVAGLLDNGFILLAKTMGPCLCVARRILIWSEDEELIEVEQRFKVKSRERKRTRERETTDFHPGYKPPYPNIRSL